jgi:hypothetical protein
MKGLFWLKMVIVGGESLAGHGFTICGNVFNVKSPNFWTVSRSLRRIARCSSARRLLDICS